MVSCWWSWSSDRSGNSRRRGRRRFLRQGAGDALLPYGVEDGGVGLGRNSFRLHVDRSDFGGEKGGGGKQESRLGGCQGMLLLAGFLACLVLRFR
jgi:hypothetical protein